MALYHALVSGAILVVALFLGWALVEDSGLGCAPIGMVVLAMVGRGNGARVWVRGRGWARVAAGIPPEEPASSKAGMPRSWRWVLGVVGALLVLAGGVLVSIGTAGPDWLKSKLIAAARERLGADLRIESLTFSAWTGEGELRGVGFHRMTHDSEIRATVDVLRIKVRIGALLLRAVEIERLDLDRPKVDWTVRSPRDSTTWGKVLKLAGASRGRSRSLNRLEVDDFRIRDGVVEFVSLREGCEPLRARASGIQYRAREISLDSFGGLMWGADVQANVDLGSSTAVLKKQGSASPATFSLSRIDLAYADRYFDPDDALVIAGGAADVRYALGDDGRARMEIELRGLRLGENASAAKQEFAFVPVARLREIVSERNGNFRLEFALDDGVEASGDLRLLLDEVWTAMWKALIRSMSEGALRDLFQKGKEKVLDRLKPGEEK
jgi:hypothetical protein